MERRKKSEMISHAWCFHLRSNYHLQFLPPMDQIKKHVAPFSDPRGLTQEARYRAIRNGLAVAANPATQAKLSYYTAKSRAAAAAKRLAEGSLILPDRRKIIFHAKRTQHNSCMNKWARACCREFHLPALQVIADHPDILCPACMAKMRVHYEGQPISSVTINPNPQQDAHSNSNSSTPP